jgi:hypothetical protein
MKNGLIGLCQLTVAICIAAILITGCATGTGIDGGIVGTGNRPNCEPNVAKDGTRIPLPEECARQR